MMIKALYWISLAMLVGVITIFALFGPVRIVMSDSMAPAIRAGDALLLGKPPKQYSPGMIISYQLDQKLITHRVVGMEGGSLLTKGDNNQQIDPWVVPVSSVRGAPLVVIPYLGFALDFIRKPLGWLFFVLLPAAWIILGQLNKIVNSLRETARQS